MSKKERRKYARVQTSNLASFVSQDKDGNETATCIARTLNLSPAGVLIETFRAIESEYIWLTTLDQEDNLIEIKGKVIHSKKLEDGRFEIGIGFQGEPAEIHKFVKELVLVHTIRKTQFVKVTAL